MFGLLNLPPTMVIEKYSSNMGHPHRECVRYCENLRQGRWKKNPRRQREISEGVEEKGKGIKGRRGMADVYLYQLH